MKRLWIGRKENGTIYRTWNRTVTFFRILYCCCVHAQ